MVGADRARLVGREEELRQVRAAVDEARSGRPTFLLLEGEAGIGKSRLVEEARAAYAEPHEVVITSQAVELSGGGLPYGVVAAALRDFARQDRSGLVNTIDPAARATLRGLAQGLTGGSSERLDRGVVLDSFLSAVEALCRTRLLWWVIEDLQWADPSSRDVLAYLAKTIGPCRFLVLSTLRSDSPRTPTSADFLEVIARSPGSRRLKVSRLSAAQTEQLTRQLSDDQLTARLVRRVIRLGEGIPLWTEELVLGGLRPSGPVPESVRDLLEARLMRLAPVTRSVVEAVSLVDRAPHDQLAEVLSRTERELENACAEAVEARVLVVDEEGGGYRFRHALLRETVSAGLLPGPRLRLHRGWAEVLERRAGTDGRLSIAAAHHWAETGQPGKALDAALAVAAVAYKVAAYHELGLLWSRALDLWPSVPDAQQRTGVSIDEVALRCIIALFAAGDYEGCLARLDVELARTSTDGVRTTYLRLRRVVVLEELARDNDDPGVLADLPRTARELLDPEETSSWLVATQLMVAYYVSDEDAELAMQLSQHALKLARAAEDIDMEMGAVDNLSWSLGNLGRFEEAIEVLQEAVGRAHVLAPTWAFMLEGSLAWYLWGLGRYADSVAAAQSALRFVQRPRVAPERVAWLVESLGESLISAGRWDEAAERLDGVTSTSFSGQAAVTVHCMAGVLSVRRGALEEARELCRRARQHTPPQEDSLLSQRVPPRWLDAEIAYADDDVVGVRAALAPLWRAPHPEIVSETLWRPLLLAAQVEADVAVRPAAGKAASSAPEHDVWQELMDVSAAMHDLGPVTKAWRLQLEVERLRSERADSAAEWAEVAERWSLLRQPYEHACALLRQAECALREGDRPAGADLVEEVTASADRLGAVPLRERAAALARRARLEPVTAGSQDLVVDGVRRPPLTPRELEVLALLARGHDNAQVASLLFISAKTASVHVSHILAKLGVSSRTQAVSLALRRGLVPDDLDA